MFPLRFRINTHFSSWTRFLCICIKKEENSALRIVIHLSVSSEALESWLGNCHLTHLSAQSPRPHRVSIIEVSDDTWWPVKCYMIQSVSCNLLFYFLNQRATWLKFLGRDKQAIFQMNDRASLPNNSIKRVRGTNGKGNEHETLLGPDPVLEGTEKPSRTHHHHWPVRNTRADMSRTDGLPERKTVITISHFINLELCFQGITRRGDYLTEKMHMAHSWPDWHWDAYDTGLHIYLQNTM